MKVLLIANKAEFGGATKCLKELIHSFINANIDVELVVFGENYLYKFCEENGIECHAIGHVSFASGKGSTLFRKIIKFILIPYYYLKQLLQNKKALKRAIKNIDFSKIDIIHTNSNRDSIGAMLSKKYNIPHIWHLREFGKEDYNLRYYKLNYIKFMNKNTSKFIAISDAVKEAWIRKGIDSNKIVKIYDGIKLPDKKIFEEKLNAKIKDEKKFVYLGLVCPTKGQLDAVKAICSLNKTQKEHISIDFWGNYELVPEYTNKIMRYAHRNEFHNLKFCGISENIWEILPNYDYAFVCSKSEAFGLITPEYLSTGIIPIVSNQGANIELIQDNVNGFIYEYKNNQSLKKCLEKIFYLSDDELKKIQKNTWDSALKFTDIINSKNIIELYYEIGEKQ